MVTDTYDRAFTGHYKALEWNEKEAKYLENPDLGIMVEVDVSTPLSYGQSSDRVFLR